MLHTGPIKVKEFRIKHQNIRHKIKCEICRLFGTSSIKVDFETSMSTNRYLHNKQVKQIGIQEL